MKTSLRLLSFLLLALVCAATARARSPEETLLAFVAAVQNEGLPASVRFIHPAELAAFRTEFEPEIEKRIKSGRTRQQFIVFTDPYNQKQMRPFKDDADFVGVFIKWLSTSGMVGVSTFDNATVTPLGTVIEDELRHVVARFKYTNKDQASGKESSNEVVAVTSMRMADGQPMLLLLPELRNFANLVRQGR